MYPLLHVERVLLHNELHANNSTHHMYVSIVNKCTCLLLTLFSTLDRSGDIDGAILGGVGHSEGVALGVAG